MAACWPDQWRRVLVEADPAGGDLAARYRLPVTPGLVSLAAAARHSIDPTLVGAHVQPLPGGLPVLLGPTRPDQARAALDAITGVDGRAGVLGSFTGRSDVVAVVDCGRLDPGSPLRGVIEAADQVLIVARPRADELAHVADLGAASVAAGLARTRLLLSGRGYPPSEVEREVRLTVAGAIPWDPRTAAAISGHASGRPRAGAKMVRAVTRLAAEVAGEPRHMPLDHDGEPADRHESSADASGRQRPAVSANGRAAPWLSRS